MENTPPEKRRRRPPLACIACRRRKVRCDRKLPCQNCVRARKAASCSYVSDERIEPREGTEGFADGINGRDPQRDAVSSVPFFTPAASNPSSSPEQLVQRVKQLEQQLGEFINARNDNTPDQPEVRKAYFNNENFNPPTASRFLGPEHWQVQGSGIANTGLPRASCSGEIQQSNREREDHSTGGNANAILAKSRYLGNSHWIHGVTLFPRLMLFLESLKSDKNSEGYKAVAQSKVLGRQIKAMRVPQIMSLEFGNHIPSKQLADELVEAYLRTYETIHRVLHIPSFRLEYARYWQNPKGARQAFVIQLQLCMAIGAVLQDDQFSLRSLAVRWVYEGRLWLLQPSEKSRMNLSGLQVCCLVHLARDVCGVGSDLVWASAGTMMRMALYIGLHRDPDHLPKMSLLAAETRRRLWATILEILVQSSMDSGGPPLISLSDYDTEPPSNYNDEDLLRDTTGAAEVPRPKPLATFTDTSVQIGLVRTVKVRIEIASYLNEFRSMTSYDKSLAINSELTVASRSLDALLRAHKRQNPGPSQFQLRTVEHIMQRYFLAIHLPWLGHAKDDPRYFFSRRLCVEAGLRHHRAVKAYRSMDPVERALQEPDDYARLLICGSGSVRFIGTQCLLAATLEFVWELDERLEGARSLDLSTTASASTTPAAGTPGAGMGFMGPMVDEGEMLDVLRCTVDWMRARIKAGEVNVKGFLFATAVLAEAEGLTIYSSEEQLKDIVRQACFSSAREALNLLKEMHAALGGGDPTNSTAEENNADAAVDMGDGPQGSADEDAFSGMGYVEQFSKDWDWDFIQDPSYNLNFNINLGGMDLVFSSL